MHDPADQSLEVHFLDVGPTKYGDCILVRRGQTTILIDGGHPGDTRDRPGYPSIPRQLRQILSIPQGSIHLSLLVVTHAHNDHIGCLPEMVESGIITCDRAYVADVDLGWGDLSDAASVEADGRVERMMAIIREGAGATINTPNPDQAIADAIALKRRYTSMIAKLESRPGTEVITCTGDEDRDALENLFASIGLRILGPSREHLRVCGAQLQKVKRDVADALRSMPQGDLSLSDSQLSRAVLDAIDDSGPLADMFGEGSALNCQSIILALEFGGRKVLLPGDMQLADAQVNDLDDEMASLRAAIQNFGPYDLIKTTHHTSYNGLDQEVLDEQAPSQGLFFLVHTGGINDSHHPESSVLSLLRRVKKSRPEFTWLRTDRNGLISFAISPDGTIRYEKAKGRINTFQVNTDEAATTPPLPMTTIPQAEPVVSTSTEKAPTTADRDYVEVIARVPHSSTKVTLTIAVEPGARAAGPTVQAVAQPERIPAETPADPRPIAFSLGARSTPTKLLFVTDEQALGSKIGRGNTSAALRSIRDAGHVVIGENRLASLSALDAAELIRPNLSREFDGVVLLGDYNVVPSLQLDVLGPNLRAQVEDPDEEPDGFIVWNDELYGDLDGDQMPELPVSRIPDGGSAQTLAAALGARNAGTQKRFGIRNAARPFANTVFQLIQGAGELRASEPFRSSQLRPREVEADCAYFMLHGDDAEGRRFWGETRGTILEAFTLDQVPARFDGVVFTGCCWGALISVGRARLHPAGQPVRCRTARDSIAIRFLAAGAQAFVGCTGVHYSPPGDQPTSAGGPMHTAFFNRLVGGEPPARALLLAKQDSLRGLDENASPEEVAVALKIIRQFTCLGLGW